MTYEQRDSAYTQYISDNNIANVKRINSFRFDTWQSLSHKFLILSTTVTKKYLIEITRDCNNLVHSHVLVFKQAVDGSLQARFDSILVGGENIPCRIQAIYPLTVEQAKAIANIGMPTNAKDNNTNADS
ncbi:DUF6491 family protein [Thalassotalea piscium]|uniref:DUF6491 family protein n=1 Tax=Thalassotalea piscium TaxID=1230533 RepID=UPI001C870155|nr:DUF6491 family protein [Thalassotalea piscium]